MHVAMQCVVDSSIQCTCTCIFCIRMNFVFNVLVCHFITDMNCTVHVPVYCITVSVAIMTTFKSILEVKLIILSLCIRISCFVHAENSGIRPLHCV